jgi:hypothetical protein
MMVVASGVRNNGQRRTAMKRNVLGRSAAIECDVLRWSMMVNYDELQRIVLEYDVRQQWAVMVYYGQR